MLEAFRAVRERVPGAELRLVGPVQDGAEAFVRQAGEGVSATGRVAYDRIAEELDRARVGLALLADTPKYRRDVPSKLYDYMSAGVPYVASDLPGIRSAVGEAGGLLVDPAHPERVADAIVHLLTDDAAARSFREAGLAAVADRFSFDEDGQRLVEAVSELIDARGGATAS